jgi:hypothetical protein
MLVDGVDVISNVVLTANEWQHVAIVRNGNEIKIFVNGAQSGNTYDATGVSIGASTTNTIGGAAAYHYFYGYLDELRISKGIARWTSSFAVSDKAYSSFELNADISDSATVLTLDTANPNDLNSLGQPTGIIKIGSEKIKYKTISFDKATGIATLQNLTRGYVGTTATSHSNNDSITLFGNWRNNSFARETSWFKKNGAFPEKALLVGTGEEGQIEGGLSIVNLENNSLWKNYDAGTSNTIKSAVKTISATNGKVFIGYGSIGDGTTELDFAKDTYSDYEKIDSDTKLLLHMDGIDNGTTFTDSSDSNHSVTGNGNTVTKTAVKKFGTASGYFDGAGDYLSIPDSVDWDLGTADFTVDFWANFNSSTGYAIVFNTGGGTWESGGIFMGFKDNHVYHQLCGNAINNQGIVDLSGAWHHYALVRSGDNIRSYVDGVEIDSSTGGSSCNLDNAHVPYIGAAKDINATMNFFINGYVDDLRVSKGIARWTSNFTPPTSVYSVNDIESYFDNTNTNVWAAFGKSETTGTNAGISYLYDSAYKGTINTIYYLTSDTDYWVSKIYYDSSNDDLYVIQTNGLADQDIWSKISSPRISSDSTIDSADGTDRLTSMPIAYDITADNDNLYLATASGVKKVSKTNFSSGVIDTLDSSDFSELSINEARTINYDSNEQKLVTGFSNGLGHDGITVISNVSGASPTYFDYFGETDVDRNNSLVSDVFYSSTWIPFLLSDYTSFVMGTNQGISIVNYSSSSYTPKPPAINSDNTFLIF